MRKEDQVFGDEAAIKFGKLVEELKSDGVKPGDIARRFSISPSTLRLRMKRYRELSGR